VREIQGRCEASARSSPSRHGSARFVTVPGGIRDEGHRSSCVPAHFAEGRGSAFVACTPIGGLTTNARSRRPEKICGTVTFHGSSSRDTHARRSRVLRERHRGRARRLCRPRGGATPGEFAETRGMRGKVRTHPGGRTGDARTCVLFPHSRPSRPRPQPARAVDETAASLSASGASQRVRRRSRRSARRSRSGGRVGGSGRRRRSRSTRRAGTRRGSERPRRAAPAVGRRCPRRSAADR
jgi:hypothetical protein